MEERPHKLGLIDMAPSDPVDIRLDLSFDEFCEYLKTGSEPTGGSGVESAEKHGKIQPAEWAQIHAATVAGSAPTGVPGWEFVTYRTSRVVPENTGGDRKAGVWGRIWAALRGT